MARRIFSEDRWAGNKKSWFTTTARMLQESFVISRPGLSWGS